MIYRRWPQVNTEHPQGTEPFAACLGVGERDPVVLTSRLGYTKMRILVRHVEGKIWEVTIMGTTERYTQKDGRRLFEEDRARMMADPEVRAIYEEEAEKKELWLQLIEARQATGLTQAEVAERLGVSQAQVARIEKRGYDAYTLNTLRRYVKALGEGFELEVRVRRPETPPHAAA